MRFLVLLLTVFSSVAYAADYKSAQRLSAGDVISADVFNDILDRIELTLKSASAADLVGTWTVTQTTCGEATGALGNCSDIDPAPQGFTTSSDGNLTKQRSDTVVFTDDGDGSFSLSTSSYCAFVRSGTGNSACSISYNVVDGFFIINNNGYAAYTLQKVSSTRYVMGMNASGSGSFNVIRLDKNALPPESPSALAATIEDGTVSLTWTANDENVISYSVHSKDAADGTFAELNISTSTSLTDTLADDATRWYRVFAVNADGTSLGSNVIKITNTSDD